MLTSKECNGKSRVEYEMSNKQWVINEIFCEKAKRKQIFHVKCLNRSGSAYRYLFCYKKSPGREKCDLSVVSSNLGMVMPGQCRKQEIAHLLLSRVHQLRCISLLILLTHLLISPILHLQYPLLHYTRY